MVQQIQAQSSGVRPGQMWRGTQKEHLGWDVEVLKLSQAKVHFLCRTNRGKNRGRVQKMYRDAFPHCFELLREDRASRRGSYHYAG